MLIMDPLDCFTAYLVQMQGSWTRDSPAAKSLDPALEHPSLSLRAPTPFSARCWSHKREHSCAPILSRTNNYCQFRTHLLIRQRQFLFVPSFIALRSTFFALLLHFRWSRHPVPHHLHPQLYFFLAHHIADLITICRVSRTSCLQRSIKCQSADLHTN